MLLSAVGWGASYDPFLLNTQLSLLPKIAMLEKNLSRSKAPLKILIAYDRDDEHTAASCARRLMNQSCSRPISVSKLSFDKLEGSGPYHLVYALKGSMQQLKKVRQTFDSAATLTALYDGDKLCESGLFLSVQMERSPIILINAKTLRENRFTFPDSLLEMARIVE